MKRLITQAILAASMLTTAGAAQDPKDLREPAAMAALDRMGAALRKQAEFTVHADLTAEDVLVSGQKLQYGGTLDIAARRPSGLRMKLDMGSSERQLYYDGKSLTIFSPDRNAYATAAAPATIRETLAAAADEYGLYIPLSDLFVWGEDATVSARVQSAFYVGKESIGEEACDHYALQQPLVDWQIWIREGDNALPCKLVITSVDDPAMPQVTAVYHWGTQPVPEASAFTFAPPEGALKIQFAALKAATSKSGK